MASEGLSERETRVLEAVIQTYVETAEPAGSQTVAQRFALGVSSATIRNTMGELEEKGYLYHPHTSAGRIPTDRAYRWYVDNHMRLSVPAPEHRRMLEAELSPSRAAIEEIIRSAAQVLGLLTRELGVAIAPVLDAVVLERLELVPVSSERLLLVFHLRSGAVRTIFVQVAGSIEPEVVQRVSQTLNERLAGLTLLQIRTSVVERLRDADSTPRERQLLNIFIEEGEEIFGLPAGPDSVVLGSTQSIAGQPEFLTGGRIRDLLELTDQRDLLRQALSARRDRGLTVTIGGENDDPRLSGFTVVTSCYRTGELSGVIGVIGPTRMPYDKIIGLVDHTSRMMEGLME